MKAITIKQEAGLENIRVANDLLARTPDKGEIKVRVLAGSLNYHDYLVAAGVLATEDNRILLSDGAGVVEEVGEGVTDFKIGDHVVSTFFPQWERGLVMHNTGDFNLTPGDGVDGMASEFVTRPDKAFTLAPTAWTHAESATITTAGLTAWRALIEDGNLKAGDTVLTLGTGGVSITALQIAKMHGAQVIITSSSDEKLRKAKLLGADFTINCKNNPQWSEEVLEITNGRGVDHVIELGGPGTLENSINACAVGGHISLIGVLTGFNGDFPAAQLLFKQIRLQGLLVGNRQHQKNYISAINANEMRPIIDSTFKYHELARAFEYQLNGAHFGKICVEW